mmetsp:Transcript_2157/g.4976  ORF Transcript_2157/g.4976 Transcript_2157/m.4976 type:complete len:215 (-) Transcript_2157:289-933(-)
MDSLLCGMAPPAVLNQAGFVLPSGRWERIRSTYNRAPGHRTGRPAAQHADAPTAPGDRSVWQLLDVPANTEKSALRKRFKEFVRAEHPDLRGGERSPHQTEQFTQVMAKYKELMKANDDAFWLESFCAQIAEVNARRSAHSLRRREERRRQAVIRLRESKTLGGVVLPEAVVAEKPKKNYNLGQASEALGLGIISVLGFLGFVVTMTVVWALLR